MAGCDRSVVESLVLINTPAAGFLACGRGGDWQRFDL